MYRDLPIIAEECNLNTNEIIELLNIYYNEDTVRPKHLCESLMYHSVKNNIYDLFLYLYKTYDLSPWKACYFEQFVHLPMNEEVREIIRNDFFKQNHKPTRDQDIYYMIAMCILDDKYEILDDLLINYLSKVHKVLIDKCVSIGEWEFNPRIINALSNKSKDEIEMFLNKYSHVFTAKSINLKKVCCTYNFLPVIQLIMDHYDMTLVKLLKTSHNASLLLDVCVKHNIEYANKIMKEIKFTYQSDNLETLKWLKLNHDNFMDIISIKHVLSNYQPEIISWMLSNGLINKQNLVDINIRNYPLIEKLGMEISEGIMKNKTYDRHLRVNDELLLWLDKKNSLHLCDCFYDEVSIDTLALLKNQLSFKSYGSITGVIGHLYDPEMEEFLDNNKHKFIIPY